jgi:hypothetical protein
LKNIRTSSYDVDVLSELIGNLRTALTVIVFVGFVVFAGLLIAAEHRYYVLHFEGKYKYSIMLYWLIVFLTVAALIVIYRIFFLEIYPSQVTSDMTAYV